MSSETDLSKRGTLLYEVYPGLDAYKYARILTMQRNRMKVFVRSDIDDDNRPICRIVLDGKDYSELTLEKGLSYTYPAFHINMSFLQNKRRLFTYPDEAHLLLLPWKFRSGIVHMNSYCGSSRQVDLCMQKGKFFKVCVLY